MSIINGFGASGNDKLTKSLLLCSDRFNAPTIKLDESTSKYILSLPYEIESYEIGKLVCIQGVTYNGVNEYVNPYLNIGGLGNVPVNGTIKSGKCYNLMYDGNQFIMQLSSMGISGAPIAFTTTGVYNIDEDLKYKVTVVGGGGGGASVSGYMLPGHSSYGGGGGVVTGEYTPTSSSISVTIGAGGEGEHNSSSGSATGTDGGSTTACGFTAQGGKAGYAVMSGTSGTGTNGTSGTGGSATGYYYNGSYYGKGGSGSGSGTAGIVILVPILS